MYIFKNSLIIPKGIHSGEGIFICDKTNVHLHKTFASIIFTLYNIDIENSIASKLARRL